MTMRRMLLHRRVRTRALSTGSATVHPSIAALAMVADSAASAGQNGDMLVTAEMLTTVISFAALLVAIAGGFGWVIHRSDAQFRALSDKLDERTRMLQTAVDAQTRELNEVKVAVARLEGPTQRLIPAR